MWVLHVLFRGLIQQDEQESKVHLASRVWLLGTQSQMIKKLLTNPITIDMGSCSGVFHHRAPPSNFLHSQTRAFQRLSHHKDKGHHTASESAEWEQGRLDDLVGSQHDPQSQSVLRSNCPVYNHHGNSSWCSTYRGFHGVQWETTHSLSHSIWLLTFSCYRSGLLHSSGAPTPTPQLHAAVLRTYCLFSQSPQG